MRIGIYLTVMTVLFWWLLFGTPRYWHNIIVENELNKMEALHDKT